MSKKILVPFSHVPTVPNHTLGTHANESVHSLLIATAANEELARVMHAFKDEPMLTIRPAPASIVVNDLSKHVRNLRANGIRIHSKVLTWRDELGYEHKPTYYGLWRNVQPSFFIWSYEVSLLQAFDHLEACLKEGAVDINPRQNNLSVPEKLQIYNFFASMLS